MERYDPQVVIPSMAARKIPIMILLALGVAGAVLVFHVAVEGLFMPLLMLGPDGKEPSLVIPDQAVHAPDLKLPACGCIVGPDKCVSSGAEEPGGCGVCDPARNPNGWTRGAGCKVTHTWSRALGGASFDRGWGVAADGAGNVYVAGRFDDGRSFGGAADKHEHGPDVFVASFTPDGQHRWSKTWSESSSVVGYALTLDRNANVYVTGMFGDDLSCGGDTLQSNGMYNTFLCVFDSQGKHLWSDSWGSTRADEGQALDVDSKGNVYITGKFSDPINFGGGTIESDGTARAFLASFDGKGKHRWSRGFGSTRTSRGTGLAVDRKGNVYITGDFFQEINFGGGSLKADGNSDIFLASFNSKGAHRWSKRFGDSPDDGGHDLAMDDSDNIYITGTFFPRIDFGGGQLNSEGRDAFVASFTPSGAHRWSKSFGGNYWDEGYGLAVDKKGNSYVTGYSSGTFKFGSKTYSSNGNHDLFIASFDPSGAPRWSRFHGGSDFEKGHQVAAGPAGQVYVTGYFRETVDFGGGDLAARLNEGFLLRLDQ